MEILFTGASSFTGMWMVIELAKQGHTVHAIFQKPFQEYRGMRKIRVENVVAHCHPHFGVSFGSNRFFSLIRSLNRCDLFCHHAAEVTDYKSPQFDAETAYRKNTQRLDEVLSLLVSKGCHKMALTGSVFEQNEGVGRGSTEAFSPYGYSKGITAEICMELCAKYSMRLGKFVIANPFGPYEEDKFTTYLAKMWLHGEIPQVKTPEYIRDNVPVTLLSKKYAQFVNTLPNTAGFIKCSPGGYTWNQGQFTCYFSQQMQSYWGMSCDFTLLKQSDFSEPLERINGEALDWSDLNWDENTFWNDLSTFYRQHLCI